MSVDLRAAATDYLRQRRARGYRLADHDWIVAGFLDQLEAKSAARISVTDALAFAVAPHGTGRRWHAQRLAVIRGLAAHVHDIDPESADLIPPGLITAKVVRRVPYLYRPEEVTALMDGAERLRPALLGASIRTLIGLLAATGLRSGEALALDIPDVSFTDHVISVTGKYGKRRSVPVHPSTTQALADYLRLRGCPTPAQEGGPLLVGAKGGRLHKGTAYAAFRTVADEIDLPARPGSGPPLLHGFRHAFAVDSLLDAHRQDADVDARVAVLATYLGHVNPANTYWYLTASPELMQAVRDRMSAYQREGSKP